MVKPVNAVWQKLKEARVIGDVVNNFVPRIYVHVIYRHKRFSLGNELLFSVAQSQPDNIEIETEDFDVDMQQQVSNSKFVIIMTDPQRAPGCEYLHWVITDYEPSKRCGAVIPWKELVPYEPPTCMLTQKIVLTVFRQNQAFEPKPQRRALFSTRVFAASNGLGSPVGASFCYIKNVSQKDQNESATSSTRNPYYIQDVNQND